MTAAFYGDDFVPTQTYDPKVASMGKSTGRLPVPTTQQRNSVDIGPYTMIPNKFFGSGMAAHLGSSAGFIYIALCEHANRHSNVKFKASDKALASETGIAPRTICNARKRLAENGLISYKREKGQCHDYTLLKPLLTWKPLKERPRRALNPRAIPATRMQQV